jgi:predicted nuclease with TOPRIM domain
MNFDATMAISIMSSVAFASIAWGAMQAQVRSLKERVEEMRAEKASMEKLEGFEERVTDKLESLEERIGEIRSDLQILKKNS